LSRRWSASWTSATTRWATYGGHSLGLSEGLDRDAERRHEVGDQSQRPERRPIAQGRPEHDGEEGDSVSGPPPLGPVELADGPVEPAERPRSPGGSHAPWQVAITERGSAREAALRFDRRLEDVFSDGTPCVRWRAF
jgi:hypothetical protein